MVGLNLLVKPIWVLTEMEVQDVVGHQAWGMYAAAMSFGFLFLTLADLGINYYATKSLAAAPEQLRAQFPQLISVKLVLLLVYPLLMYGAGWSLGYEAQQLYLLVLLSLVQAGAQLMEFFRANFRALQRFGWDALLSITDRLLLLGLVLGLLATGLSIEQFVYARLLAIGLSVVLFYALLTRLHGWLRPRFSWRLVRQLVRGSLPFAAMTMLYSIHDKVDQVMLERMAGDVPTGLYAAAYRWLDALSMYLWMVLPMFFARFAHHQRDGAEQQKLLKLGQLITGLPLTFVCVAGWFGAEELFFLYDQSTAAAELAVMTACLRALFVALLINGHLAVFSTLLTSTGHERFVNRLIGLSIALNVLLNALLIPAHGAVACAWATVASFALSGVGYLAYIHGRLPVAVPWAQLGRQALAAALLVGSWWGLEHWGWPWWQQVLLAGPLFLAGTAALRLWHPARLRAGLRPPPGG